MHNCNHAHTVFTSSWNTLCRAAEVNFLTALICLLKKLPCFLLRFDYAYTCAWSLICFNWIPICGIMFHWVQLLQNPAALAWSWKAMLKYTQPYYMPPAAKTIFWIWVSAAKDNRDSLLKEMHAPWHHDSLLKEIHTPWHQILNWATTQIVHNWVQRGASIGECPMYQFCSFLHNCKSLHCTPLNLNFFY